MTAIKVPYLGRVGDLRRLPSTNAAFGAAPSRGESEKALASGGTGVLTRLNERRRYTLPYSYLPPVDADVIRGFYLGTVGLGPYLFVDPTVRNVLALDVSSCGIRSQAAHGWTASAGTLTRATGAPTDASGSGVLAWTGATASASLQPTFSVLTAPASLPPFEPVTVSLYVKASSTATFALQMVGYDPAGTVLSTSVQTSFTAGTAWSVQSVTALASNSTMGAAALLLPRLVCPASSVPATISIAAAQIEYGDTRTAWQFGNGAPRVVIPTSPGREVQQTTNFAADLTLTLAEI